MLEADLGEVLRIERAAYGFPWSPTVFRDCLRVGYSCWVLPGTAGLEGYAIMSVAAGEAHILNVCVDPALQGGGRGRTLVSHLLKEGRRHGAHTAYLEVRPSNRPAVHLYEKLGFRQVGLRRGYYPARDGREDALVYALGIGREPSGAG